MLQEKFFNYSDKDDVKISDLYDVVAREEAYPTNEFDGVVSKAIWGNYEYENHIIKPGYEYTLLAWIRYDSVEDVKIRFKTDKTCNLVVGLRDCSTDRVYASKAVSCTANQVVNVPIKLGAGKAVHPFILNTSGFSVKVSDVNVYFFAKFFKGR